MPSESLEILYLQEFDYQGANPYCAKGDTYKNQVWKMFPKLKALDGYRKAVGDIVNMKDALPSVEDETFAYNVDSIEWFNQAAIMQDQPAKGMFEDPVETKREENALRNILNDCKNLMEKRTHITKL